jgi:hypothetical protein
MLRLLYGVAAKRQQQGSGQAKGRKVGFRPYRLISLSKPVLSLHALSRKNMQPAARETGRFYNAFYGTSSK